MKFVIETRIHSGLRFNLLIMIGRTRDRRAGLIPHLSTSGLIPSLMVCPDEIGCLPLVPLRTALLNRSYVSKSNASELNSIYIYLGPFPWHSVWRGRFFEFFTSRLNAGLLGCQRQQAGLIQRHKTTPRLSPRSLGACRWYHSALHCSLASSRSQ
jgi:hypothetical protein